MPADRDLDNILDEALTTYSHAEPDPSLRARIIAHAETHRPRHILWPAAVACTAAALLIAFLLPRTAPVPQRVPVAPSTIASAVLPKIPTPVPEKTQHRYIRAARHRAPRPARTIARSDVFPSPTPLTAQEITLLQFVSEHPEQARQALATRAAGLVETVPVVIKPIRIAALSEPPGPQPLQ